MLTSDRLRTLLPWYRLTKQLGSLDMMNLPMYLIPVLYRLEVMSQGKPDPVEEAQSRVDFEQLGDIDDAWDNSTLLAGPGYSGPRGLIDYTQAKE